LKLSLDWAVQRSIWRGQAVYIRSLFDANKDVRDPRQQQVRDYNQA
jgi:NADH dehydrogenase (ubiquinone) 1 beta subcomplex subunit 9